MIEKTMQSRCLSTEIVQTKALWMKMFEPREFDCLLAEKEINGIRQILGIQISSVHPTSVGALD